MPQLDLESLFCIGGGESKSKVACETAALPASDAVGGQCNTTDDDRGVRAESCRIKRWDGFSWGSCRPGLAVAALERDGSTKGTSNPKAAAAEAAAVGKREGASRPRRLPAVFVGLLAGSGKVVLEQRCSPVLGRGWRRPATGARVFASGATAAEPVSPKVSCFGAVRSERRAAAPVPPWEADKQIDGSTGCWCWASVTAALQHLCPSNNRCEGESESSEPKEDTTSTAESPTVAVLSPPRPILGLGDVKRLASRRWPDSLSGEGRASV